MGQYDMVALILYKNTHFNWLLLIYFFLSVLPILLLSFYVSHFFSFPSIWKTNNYAMIEATYTNYLYRIVIQFNFKFQFALERSPGFDVESGMDTVWLGGASLYPWLYLSFNYYLHLFCCFFSLFLLQCLNFEFSIHYCQKKKIERVTEWK